MMRETTRIRKEYFDWLLNFNIGGEARRYLGLLSLLHQKTFRWFIRNDDNRCEDGLALRNSFVDAFNWDRDHLEVEYFLKSECTILELLVALAKRTNDYMYDLNPDNDQTSKWFFEMITNLGFDRFSGKTIGRMHEVEIDDVLESLMDRTYDYYGHGSLFPVEKRPHKDMAKVEIWYQLMEYLDQKYG